MTKDKLAAYQTLYTALEAVAMMAAPIAPFFMDRLFLDLNAMSGRHNENSVHVAPMPSAERNLIDPDLESRMDLAQRCSSMILALRRKVNINVRQPLAKMIIPIPVLDPQIEERFEKVKSLVLNEVNVKEVEYIKDTAGLITKKIKPNFKLLGKKYGKQMKEIAAYFNNMSQNEIADIERSGALSQNYTLSLASSDVVLEPADYEIISENMPGWLVATDGQLTTALDITVTSELKNEGVARELINRIQRQRKDCGFEVTDKIIARIESREDISEAVKSFGGYIASQTLALNVEVVENLANGNDVEWIDDNKIKIELIKQ